MKQVFIFVAIILSGYISKAQEVDNIVGKWKLVAFSDSEVYYNLDKDSLAIKNSTGENFNPDKAQGTDSTITSLKKFLNEFLGKISFEFKNDHTYKFEGDLGGMFDGKYEVDTKNKIINLKEVTKAGEGKEDGMKYEMRNGKLFLFINNENESVVELKKEKAIKN